MAVPTNTEQTYGLTNIREDLSDLVYNVDPFKTPIFNTAKKEEAKQTFHEWDMDALAAQNTGNASVEGDNPTNIALTATARVGNRTQISTKTIQLSGTSQSVIAAGGTNRMGYQLAKKSKELKRDIEGIITNNAAQVTGSATVARVTAGLPAWLQNNTVFNSGGSPAGANPTGVTAVGTVNFGNGTTARTYSGAKQSVSESDVKSVLQKIYTASGDCPEYCFLSPVNKQNVSAFTGPGTRFIEVEDKTLMTAVDVYQSDFGDVKMVPDIFLATSGDMYFINPNYLKCAYLRPFQVIPLAKTGDSDQKMMLAEYALVVANEHAHGARFDTNG